MITTIAWSVVSGMLVMSWPSSPEVALRGKQGFVSDSGRFVSHMSTPANYYWLAARPHVPALAFAWDAVPEAVAYEVSWGFSEAARDRVERTTTASFSPGGVATGQTVYLSVRTVDAEGRQSLDSEIVSWKKD